MASSTSSLTRLVSSFVSPVTSSSSRCWEVGDSSAKRRSTLTLVRKLVNGVRSS